MTKSDFAFVRDEIKMYPEYKRKTERLRNDIILRTPDFDTNGGGRSNLPSKPVEEIVMDLLMIENPRLQKEMKYVNVIDDLLENMTDEMRRFVKMVFWSSEQKSVQAVCDEMAIHASTFNRWKKAFVLKVGRKTGDLRERK